MSHRHAWKEYPADRSVLFCECGAQVTWDPRDPSTHPGDCGKPDRQPFGLDTGATPDFVERATQLRKLYELIERKAGIKYESEAAEVTAEVVAFASAAAMAAHEIGLRRQAFMRLVATVADGVWTSTERGETP